MGLFDGINDAFLNYAEEGETNEPVILDNGFKALDTVTSLWQTNYALSVVTHILEAFLTNVEWKTYKGNKGNGEIVKGDEWYRFNYAPNEKETAAEFYSKLSRKYIQDGRVLIIETAKGELFIADSFEFQNGEELMMKDNTFVNVKIGDITLGRSFRENKTCIYIKSPYNQKVNDVFETMSCDYLELKKLVMEGADKALGMKLNLNLGAQSKNRYDEKFMKQLQKVYEPLMAARNAVFVTYKGEELNDLTEQQRGSEVEQVLEAVDNNIKINKEILYTVGSAFGIPQKMMSGELGEDNTDVYVMCITMFAKPILTLLSKKFTIFVLSKEDIVNGAKVEAYIDSIKFVESLRLATAVDKLIGSGAYTINEVREKIGDDPVEDGDVRFITKNYAALSEYTKGGVEE